MLSISIVDTGKEIRAFSKKIICVNYAFLVVLLAA